MQWSKIWSFLIADIYHFSLSFIHLLNETLASWHNWLLSSWSSLINWKGPVLSPRPPNCSKDSWKLLPLLISISWKSLVTEWVVVMHPVSCTSTHHDVTDLVNHGKCKNTKTWISYEWNINLFTGGAAVCTTSINHSTKTIHRHHHRRDS